jgi:uncharacterized membrane protein
MKNIAAKMLSVSLIALIVLSVMTISPALSGGAPRTFPGPGAGAATFYVNPQDYLFTSTTPTDSRIGTYFTVNVRIANATHIASWQVELSYNKNYLSTVTANCTYAADMIFPPGSYSPIAAVIDAENATHNYILMTATTTGAVEYDSGTWPASKGLITVKFRIIADPPAGIGNKLWSSLRLERPGIFGCFVLDTDLYDNTQTLIDGYYENAYLPPAVPKYDLTIQVKDTVTKNPIAGAQVDVTGPESRSASTNSTGYAVFLDLSTGDYTVTTSATGYQSDSTTVTLDQDKQIQIELTPIPPPPTTGTLNGTVTDASTTLPIQGATVTANGQSTTTDSSGHYQITLDAGTYSVTAEKTGYLANTVTGVVIIAETTTTVDIALTPIPPPPTTGTLNGTVTNASTTLPIEGATVTANGEFTTTDSSGHYQITLEAGTYSVTAEKTGYVAKTVTDVVIIAEETTTVDIALTPIPPPPTTGTLNGTVTDASTTLPIQGVTVTANGASSTTDAEGHYQIEIAPGTYTVTASKSGYVSASKSATVTAGMTTTVNFSLEPIVPDFSISASPDSLTIVQGSSGTSTITVTSLNGFNSAVGLSVSGAPTGVTATLSPTSATPPSDGSATSTLTVLVDATAAAGNYILTVTGTSGSLTHNATISLVVKAVQVIKACVEFKPEVLNLKSKGRWIACFIRLPEGYNVSDIDVSTIMLNGTVPAEPKAEVIRDCNGRVLGLMVKFDRAKVRQFILNSINVIGKETTAKLTVAGSLKDGTQFQGTDKIKVILPPHHHHNHEHHHKCHDSCHNSKGHNDQTDYRHNCH